MERLGCQQFTPQGAARRRKLNLSTAHIFLPGPSGLQVAFPACRSANACTSAGKASGDATGILCAPRTVLTSGANTANRAMDFSYAARSVSGRYSQIGAG